MTAEEARMKLKQTFAGNWESTEHRFVVPPNEDVRVVVAKRSSDWSVWVEDYRGEAGWLRRPKSMIECGIHETHARAVAERLWRKLVVSR